jgi:hypothetical protein
MGLVLDMKPGALNGEPIVYQVLYLPEGVEISIQKDRHKDEWKIVRGGHGSKLMGEGHYGSAQEALEVLKKEFPG